MESFSEQNAINLIKSPSWHDLAVLYNPHLQGSISVSLGHDEAIDILYPSVAKDSARRNDKIKKSNNVDYEEFKNIVLQVTKNMFLEEIINKHQHSFQELKKQCLGFLTFSFISEENYVKVMNEISETDGMVDSNLILGIDRVRLSLYAVLKQAIDSSSQEIFKDLDKIILSKKPDLKPGEKPGEKPGLSFLEKITTLVTGSMETIGYSAGLHIGEGLYISCDFHFSSYDIGSVSGDGLNSFKSESLLNSILSVTSIYADLKDCAMYETTEGFCLKDAKFNGFYDLCMRSFMIGIKKALAAYSMRESFPEIVHKPVSDLITDQVKRTTELN